MLAGHSVTIRFSRHDVVAASASSSAFTPSSIDVRIGLPCAERIEEVRHLDRVRDAVALEEEMLGLVGADIALACTATTSVGL